MKAIAYDEYGSPDVLTLRELDRPAPGDDEVLVRVRASSVNDYDWHLLTGRPVINRVGAPFRPKHAVLGSDVAGQVEAVGGPSRASGPGTRSSVTCPPAGSARSPSTSSHLRTRWRASRRG